VSVSYLRVNIEDHDTVQIKMSFPLIYHFLVKAFEESRDFYKSPARANPLVDDVYQTHLEMRRRQKLRIKSTALLDSLMVAFPRLRQIEDEEKEGGHSSYRQAIKRKESHSNAVAYKIDN
jgi:hypothetical protein